MAPTRRRVIPALTALAAVLLLGLAGLVLASRRPGPVGLVDGRLRPCPDRPNCVCSQDRGSAAIAPLALRGEPAGELRRLRELIAADPRAEVVAEDGPWLHAVWRTPLLGFRDDLELLLDAEAGVVHVRSASRVGRSDLGANRARVERLRERFEGGR